MKSKNIIPILDLIVSSLNNICEAIRSVPRHRINLVIHNSPCTEATIYFSDSFGNSVMLRFDIESIDMSTNSNATIYRISRGDLVLTRGN